MRSRLDRAERAIEQERAANRDLQAALQALRQVLLHSPKCVPPTVQSYACKSARCHSHFSCCLLDPAKMRHAGA